MTTVTTIAPMELARAAAQGPVDLIDVRTPAEFEEVHVEWARLAPLAGLRPEQEMIRCRATGPLYIICKSGRRAAEARRKFVDAGFDDVACVDGGLAAWEAAGLPVIRGLRRVISLERQVRVAAGSLVLLAIGLGWLVQPLILVIGALVGAGLIFAGVTDTCAMGMLLARMPWNSAPSKRGGGDAPTSPRIAARNTSDTLRS
jgi:rhodanese-related sulfurtransferase